VLSASSKVLRKLAWLSSFCVGVPYWAAKVSFLRLGTAVDLTAFFGGRIGEFFYLGG
jgi:hypothetical protein